MAERQAIATAAETRQPVVKTSSVVYRGNLAFIDADGLGVPLAGTPVRCIGIWQETVTGDGTKRARVFGGNNANAYTLDNKAGDLVTDTDEVCYVSLDGEVKATNDGDDIALNVHRVSENGVEVTFDVADSNLYMPLAGGTFTGDVTMTDGENLIAGTTTGSKIGTAAAQKLGLWGVTPVVQPADADQADQGALTAAALTDNGGGAAADGTIAEITNVANAGSADVGPVADAIKELSDQVNKLITDNAAQDVLLTAMRTALVAAGVIKGSA